MTDVWFISDTHFKHKKIIEFCHTSRPFQNIDEHDEALIHLWNSVVKPNDIVVHVGDFFVGSATEDEIVDIMKSLNGKIELIQGNHDTEFKLNIMKPFLKSINSCKVVRTYHGDVLVQHIPAHTQQVEHRFKANVHGHLHEHIIMRPKHILPDWNAEKCIHEHQMVVDDRYINVSADQINLTPVHLDTITTQIKNIGGNYGKTDTKF